MKDNILRQFSLKFKNPQIYVKSPGRANIIGEHTDYNHGLVLPFAIEQSIHLFLGENKLHKLRLFAVDLNEYIEVDTSNLTFSNEGWKRYFINSLVALKLNEGKGLDVAFGGDLPSGAGLSSSSAISCGFISGLNHLFGLGKDKDELIDLASQAENGIGLQGGTMDQTSIIKGVKKHALLIDFLDKSTVDIQLDMDGYNFYIFDSGQKHDLVTSGYNNRRSTCEKAISLIKNQKPIIKTFRDVSIHDLHEHLPDKLMVKRCSHVISENKRVEKSVDAIQNQQFAELGQLMLESHQSLSLDYEVSTPQIDYLVQQSLGIPNMIGARIMGGGFGGSTINLLKGKLDPKEFKKLKEEYCQKTGFQLKAFLVNASSGVEVKNL